MLYQLSMFHSNDRSSYTELVFDAPNDEAASTLAMSWPQLNGWASGTMITLGRYSPLQVNEEGKPTQHAVQSILLDEIEVCWT